MTLTCTMMITRHISSSSFSPLCTNIRLEGCPYLPRSRCSLHRCNSSSNRKEWYPYHWSATPPLGMHRKHSYMRMWGGRYILCTLLSHKLDRKCMHPEYLLRLHRIPNSNTHQFHGKKLRYFQRIRSIQFCSTRSHPCNYRLLTGYMHMYKHMRQWNFHPCTIGP